VLSQKNREGLAAGIREIDKAEMTLADAPAPEPEAAPEPTTEPTPTEESGPSKFEAEPDSTPAPPPDNAASTGGPPAPETTPSGEGPTEPKEGHRVPYRTYKNTRDELKGLKRTHQTVAEENSFLKQQMEQQQAQYKAELEQLRAGAPSEQPRESASETDEDWVKRQLGAYDDWDEQSPSTKRMAAIEDRLNRRDLREAQAELDSDVAKVLEAYPSVDKRVLYRAVSRDASIDLMELGLRLQNRHSENKQAIIAEFIAENPEYTREQVAAAADAAESGTTVTAPPRPRSSGNGPVAQPAADRSKGNGWDRMRAFLRNA